MLTTIFTFYIFIVMSIITKFHIYWFGGGIWPGKNKQDFIDKVLGRGEDTPGVILYIFVIISFIFMAILPIFSYYNIDYGLNAYEKYIFLFFGIIFLLRTISMFIPVIAARATKIFLEYNKRFYAPLCFTLSLSYFALFLLAN